MNDNTVIFALSTLVSSLQIFNLQNNIQEDDLQHLQLFTEFGKLAFHETGKKPFQKLLFLVRDWSFIKDYAFGKNGGQQFLEKKLKVSTEQASELKSIRENINSCFEKIECYLMPHLGLDAVENELFSGQLEDIRPVFREQLLDLVPHLLHPDQLVVKKINGEKVTGRTLFNYFHNYVQVFNSDTMPTSKTLHEVSYLIL